MTSRYAALSDYLREQQRDSVRVSFQEIDGIIGGLPDAALRHRAWWANSLEFSHARHGWLRAGWRTAEVDMEKRQLSFVRVLPSSHPLPRKCLCGCGGTLLDGDFLPGHEARARVAMERSAGGLANLSWVVRAIDSYVAGEFIEAELGRVIRTHWKRAPRAEPPASLNALKTASPPGKTSLGVSVRALAEGRQAPIEGAHSPVAERLLGISRRLEAEELLPSRLPEASAFARENPYAFCIATCLDRQMSAEVAWTIPFYMRQALGHLDPKKIGSMTKDDLQVLFGRLPRRPRFVNDAPPTVMDITRIILDEAGGDASNLWQGKTAAQVRSTFRRVHGVGPGIAAMAVLLIERVFAVRFSDLDHTTMDIKPDVHTVRVLFRLGVASVQSAEAAISAARKLNPAYPGEIDGALWRIGRNWCHALSTECAACPMNDLCLKVGL